MMCEGGGKKRLVKVLRLLRGHFRQTDGVRTPIFVSVCVSELCRNKNKLLNDTGVVQLYSSSTRSVLCSFLSVRGCAFLNPP